jgi:hypothetical protein
MSQKRTIRNPASFIETANLSLMTLSTNCDDRRSAFPGGLVFTTRLQMPESPATEKPAQDILSHH